ncbi:MAG: hypothetical protein QOJ39_434 [Candidatus Eremiobacteraeota bacterium]|jgi:hypothetical protein|nr:hypothetical protein [Candidatus Eremiobacteraeota bacterium]
MPHMCVTQLAIVSCHPCFTQPPGACPTTTPNCAISGFVCTTPTIFTTPQIGTINQGGANPGGIPSGPRTGMFNPFGGG